MLILLANNAGSAGENIGQVFVWLLMVAGTLALIYAVLSVLDRRYKKNGGNPPAEPEKKIKKKDEKTFPEVLSDEIERSRDDDGSGRV